MPRLVQIPDDSPLAVGWRAAVVWALKRHGLHAVLDTVAAYAELCCRAEPDRVNPRTIRSNLGSLAAASFPVQRRLQETEIPVGPGRPRIEEEAA